ncbi:hypothetical protein L7F22_015144 [Adiantum nelumboides]|nr:hypothetical protein [Adiantum nelumboides]
MYSDLCKATPCLPPTLTFLTTLHVAPVPGFNWEPLNTSRPLRLPSKQRSTRPSSKTALTMLQFRLLASFCLSPPISPGWLASSIAALFHSLAGRPYIHELFINFGLSLLMAVAASSSGRNLHLPMTFSCTHIALIFLQTQAMVASSFNMALAAVFHQL